MTGVLLFHHAQGLTEGISTFADQLRRAGHTVHTPDLYDGKTFPTLDEGVAFADEVGFRVLQEQGVMFADRLPAELVYMGFSLGVMPAQQLAQTRPGARGAVLLEACLPPSEFSPSWPAGVPVQVHGMEADPYFAGEGDIEFARALVNDADDGELFVYPGDRHLFTDSSLASYDADSAALVAERVLDFLDNAQRPTLAGS
jgi:dienelactone hydrolase